VSQLRTDEEGPEKPNEDAEPNPQTPDQSSHRDGQNGRDTPEVISDPDLGQNVDISG
jgi:hypothetical protein